MEPGGAGEREEPRSGFASRRFGARVCEQRWRRSREAAAQDESSQVNILSLNSEYSFAQCGKLFAEVSDDSHGVIGKSERACPGIGREVGDAAGGDSVGGRRA